MLALSVSPHTKKEKERERDGEVLSPVLCLLVYRSWQGQQLASQTTALSGSCPAVRAWRLRTVQFAMPHHSQCSLPCCTLHLSVLFVTGLVRPPTPEHGASQPTPTFYSRSLFLPHLRVSMRCGYCGQQ